MTFEEKDNLLNTYYAEVLKLKTFLLSTDYQTIRESEGGAPMPDEIRKERADARARVNELEELIAKTKEIKPEKIGHKKIWPKEIGSEEIEPEVPENVWWYNMHKVSKKIVEYMEANSLNTWFVGKNAGWKDSINLGRTNNQNFVSIPYNMLIQMLEYKCKLAGINVVIVNEAYTSKCSFLDREKISKHDSYTGKRIRRGLFISSSGIMINADVNWSLNIMRLGLEKQNVKLDVIEEILRPENKRFMLNPVRICA